MAEDHTMQTVSNTLRVIVFKEGDLWVAQCLEHDIGAQASTVDALNVRLAVVLNAELKESMERHQAPFAGIPAAPERFQMMWEHRTRSLELSPSQMMASQDRPVNLNFALVA